MGITGNHRTVTGAGPLIHKKREHFFCTDHGEDVEGWVYLVGQGMAKREICARCWVVTRLPAMKEIGVRRVRWDERDERWVSISVSVPEGALAAL